MSFDQAHFSHAASAILPWDRLALSQHVHDLKTLDRGISGLQRFEAANRSDPLFEFAVIDFDHIIQIFDLPVQHFSGRLALLLQCRDHRP